MIGQRRMLLHKFLLRKTSNNRNISFPLSSKKTSRKKERRNEPNLLKRRNCGVGEVFEKNAQSRHRVEIFGFGRSPAYRHLRDKMVYETVNESPSKHS